MIPPREVYRDRRGRFVSYWDLWQGPPRPGINHPWWQRYWNRQALKLLEGTSAKNGLLDLLRGHEDFNRHSGFGTLF